MLPWWGRRFRLPSLLFIAFLAHSQVQFTDVSAPAGLTFRHENGASKEKLMPETFGAGVAWIDYDNDGRPDLFFTNGADLARGKPSPGNLLYRSLGNGKFADVTAKACLAGNGMSATGVAVGDYDNDGYLDLFVAGYNHRQLFRNNGDGTFTDMTVKAGLGGGGWSSSAAWVDYEAQRIDLDFELGTMRLDEHGMWIDPVQVDASYAEGPDHAPPLPPEVPGGPEMVPPPRPVDGQR